MRKNNDDSGNRVAGVGANGDGAARGDGGGCAGGGKIKHKIIILEMQGMYLAHRTGFHVDSNLREVVKHRSAH
jgi:hypothetical protein